MILAIDARTLVSDVADIAARMLEVATAHIECLQAC
jgi:hypothetical protein